MSNDEWVWDWSRDWTSEEAGKFLARLMAERSEILYKRDEVQSKARELMAEEDRLEALRGRKQSFIDGFLNDWQGEEHRRNSPEVKSRREAMSEALDSGVPKVMKEGAL